MSLTKFGESVMQSHDSYSLEDAFVSFNTFNHTRSKPMHRFDYEGTASEAEVNAELARILGDPILMQEDPGDKTYYNEYVNDVSLVRIYFNRNNKTDDQVQVRGVTTDAHIYGMLKEMACKFISNKKPSNAVYALMSSRDGLALRSVGKIEHDLIKDNYSKTAMEGYDHIVDCLSSDDPCGRLILLQGPPGTGKSYMIRSLVSNIDSTFIVVGAHMIAELSGPAILPVILGCIDSDDKKPVTFILEDSDIALSHRKNGGVAELSGLLNLGDGLLGEMLDIRILATTNAELLSMDPAVVRPGRMCQHIQLDPFNAKDATALYASMVTNKEVTIKKKETTLAEIYRMVREDGWTPKAEDASSKGQYL